VLGRDGKKTKTELGKNKGVSFPPKTDNYRM